MSDDTTRTPDISKIIGVIMDNPDIIEKISSLISSEQKPTDEPKLSEPVQSAATYAEPIVEDERRRRRSQLLSAIKPYVKKSRADAIDSVIAIADIVDMMRRK